MEDWWKCILRIEKYWDIGLLIWFAGLEYQGSNLDTREIFNELNKAMFEKGDFVNSVDHKVLAI